MADVSTVMGLPYPEGSDDADVPADVLALVTRLDATPGVESLTSAQIAAIAAPQRPAGRVVHNSTTGLLMVSTGASFVNVADPSKLPLAGGTMSGPIAMGGSKITGLAAATANGDAVRFEQLSPVRVVGIAQSSPSYYAGEWKTVTYASEVDPSGLLDAAAGVVTLTAGVWAVSGTTVIAGASGDTSEVWITQVRHNGVMVAQQTVPYGNAVLQRSACVSAVVVASESDTLDMRVYNGRASGYSILDAGRLSLVRIGN